MKRRRYGFIVNPAAGRRKQEVIKEVKEFVSGSDHKILYTEGAGDAFKLAETCMEEEIIPVAVGGDGTVNEAAKAVCGSDREMGIIPSGSGNGFARHLKIPLRIRDALENLEKENVVTVDTGLAGEHFFVMLAGVGFDANVAEEMTAKKKRGFIAYAQTVLKLWRKRKPVFVDLVMNGKELRKEVFMCVAANTSQFGNNVYIAPDADISDHLLDVTVVMPFPLTALPGLFGFFLKGRNSGSPYIEQYRVRELTLNCGERVMNIDGEAANTVMPVRITVRPSSLKVLGGV